MEQKEPSSQARILIAFALSFIILFVSSRFFVGPPDAITESANPPAATPGPLPEAESPPAGAAGEPAAEFSASAAEPRQGAAEEEIIVEADLYRAVFTTRGAAVKSWTLTQYDDREGNPLELVNAGAAAEYGAPLTIWVSDATLRQEINSALFVPSATGTLRAPVTLTFEYSDSRITARKEFVFTRDSYVVNTTSELSQEGQPMTHALAWLGAFGHSRGLRRGRRADPGLLSGCPGDGAARAGECREKRHRTAGSQLDAGIGGSASPRCGHPGDLGSRAVLLRRDRGPFFLCHISAATGPAARERVRTGNHPAGANAENADARSCGLERRRTGEPPADLRRPKRPRRAGAGGPAAVGIGGLRLVFPSSRSRCFRRCAGCTRMSSETTVG